MNAKGKALKVKISIPKNFMRSNKQSTEYGRAMKAAHEKKYGEVPAAMKVGSKRVPFRNDAQRYGSYGSMK